MARKRKGRRGGGQKPDTSGHNPQALEMLANGQLAPAYRAVYEALATRPRTTEYVDDQTRRASHLSYARGKPANTLPFHVLRDIAERCVINGAIHQRRADGIRSLCRQWSGRRHQVGWAVVHDRHNDVDFDAKLRVPDLDERILRAQQILKCPHPIYAPHLEDFVIPLLDDRLTLDRPCANVIWDQGARTPVQMVPVDGATIWPCDLWMDRYIELNDIVEMDWRRAREAAYGKAYSEYGVDLSQVAYVQVDVNHSTAARPIAFLSNDDIMVTPANRSTRMDRWGFGTSPCERSWIAAAMYLFGIGYVVDFFRNSFSNMVGTLEGVQEEDAVTLVNLLRTHHMGSGKHFSTPMVPLPPGGKLDFQKTRANSAREMEFSVTIHHVVMIACAFYSEDPTSINLEVRAPGQSSLSEPRRDEVINIKRSEGLLNDGHFICDRILTPIIKKIDPDLKVIWAGIDDEREELEVQLRSQRVGSWMTINEARVEEGKKELSDDWANKPLWAAQQAHQTEMQKDAARDQAALQIQQQQTEFEMQQEQQQLAAMQQPEPEGQPDDVYPPEDMKAVVDDLVTIIVEP